jgi:hypothetical protein
MSTSLVIPTMVFIVIKASMLGGTNLVSRLATANRVVMGRISTEMSPLSAISLGIRDQERINDEVGKKIHATDKLLESCNKMLETQIQQISAAILSESNGDSSKTPIQESVRSIFTVFKEKVLKSTEGSLGGVGRDKKPSAAKIFSAKFSRCVKNAMPAVTSSPVTPVT